MNSEQVIAKLNLLDAHVENLRDRMARFESVCDGCRNNVNGKFSNMYEQLEKLDERVRALQIRVAFFSGGAALVGTVAGAVVSKLI